MGERLRLEVWRSAEYGRAVTLRRSCSRVAVHGIVALSVGCSAAPQPPTTVPPSGQASVQHAPERAGTQSDPSRSASASQDSNASHSAGGAAVSVFAAWPDAAEPLRVGLRLAQQFAAQPSDGAKHYKEACAWYGALQLAALLGDQALIDALAQRYQPLKHSYGELLAGAGHVDQNVFGIVPFELFKQRPDQSYLDDGVALARHQQAHLKEQIRFAIDDMFMITGLQVQAYRVTKERAFLDDAAESMVAYLAKLQQSDGTFHHRDTVPLRWGRGNGWVASGLTELMRELPPNHAHYGVIRAGYERMMAGLLRYQIAEGEGAGLWRQLLDYDSADNWPETSGSAMFTNALITGVKSGWLSAEAYGPAARKAWIALVGYLEPDASLRNVSNWMYQGQIADYLARERVTGDNHGQAPMLWAAAALLR